VRHWKLHRAVALVLLASALTACGTLSVEDEKKLGAQYQAELRKQMIFVRDPVTVNYVRQFGEQLSGSARPSPFEFRFYVIEDEEINAFAIPGGAVYVNTGLLTKVHNGAELAAVLSHEMGHVTARHMASSSTSSIWRSRSSRAIRTSRTPAAWWAASRARRS